MIGSVVSSRKQSSKTKHYVKNYAFPKSTADKTYCQHDQYSNNRGNAKFKAVFIDFSLFFGNDLLANKKISYNATEFSDHYDHLFLSSL